MAYDPRDVIDRSRLPSPIAIDGPAASGKSTLGHALAEEFGYTFLDTGLMYRAFTLAALREGVLATDETACTLLAETVGMRVEAGETTVIFLDHEDVTEWLRSPEVEANVSAYSAIRGVREELVRKQREIARTGPVVLAGRDIGTVVLPDAPLKFYLVASEDARARRRAAQAGDWGVNQRTSDAHRDIAGRDTVDSSRAASPLRAASDAIVVDTTDMGLQDVVDLVLEKVRCAAS